MLRFSLKTLFAAFTICAIAIAVSLSAGFWVMLALAFFGWLLGWAITTKRNRFWLLARGGCGLVSLVAIWFLAVDWSWFIWYCSDCHDGKEVYGYRVLGHAITTDIDFHKSIYKEILEDLAVPCPHNHTEYWQKHRHWGLLVCACPCWNGTLGFSSSSPWYTNSIRTSVKERGKRDPEFAIELYQQIVVNNNIGYLWDGVMADEISNDRLHSQGALEAKQWLEDPGIKRLRIFGFGSIVEEQLLTLVDEIYALGGEKVLALDIEDHELQRVMEGLYEDDRDLFNLPHLKGKDIHNIEVQRASLIAIKLPENGPVRDTLFSWQDEFCKIYEHHPSKDYDQEYLLLWGN